LGDYRIVWIVHAVLGQAVRQRHKFCPALLRQRRQCVSCKEGSFKQGEGAQCEYKFEVSAMELTVDGRQLKKIDIDNYIWQVDGVDLLADFRANLGIS